MRAEILSIGDELLIGRTVNNNAAYMGKRLAEINIDVEWLTSVGDNLERIVTAVKTAWNRAEIILLTGGLGPTHDDITKDALCRFFGVEYRFYREIVEEIRDRYQTRGIEMPEIVTNQGLIPAGADLIRNELGSAFGIRFERDGRVLIAMPGVPFEMERMMTDSVIPFLKTKAGTHTILMQSVKTAGIIESKLVSSFPRLETVRQLADVAVLPRVTGVELRLTVRNESGEEAARLMQQALEITREDIGKWIVTMSDESIEDVVIRDLLRLNRTVSTAESCTGGLVADMLTNVPGSSGCFAGGVISYSNAVKQDLLGVSGDLLHAHGAVSDEVARAMAVGIRDRIQTDFGVATTGIAGPGGATETKPAGLAYIAVTGPDGTVSEKILFNVDRKQNKQRFAVSALNLLRRTLRDGTAGV
jgi:nicotinamide-nucleotide amidase